MPEQENNNISDNTRPSIQRYLEEMSEQQFFDLDRPEPQIEPFIEDSYIDESIEIDVIYASPSLDGRPGMRYRFTNGLIIEIRDLDVFPRNIDELNAYLDNHTIRVINNYREPVSEFIRSEFVVNPEVNKPKDLDPNLEVEIFGNKKKALLKDCVFISNLGYFLSNDSRLQKDYLTGNVIVIDEKISYKIYSNLHCIFTEIDENGKLIKPVFTININNRNPFAVVIYSDNYVGNITPRINVTIDLLKNETFNKYFIENLRDGIYYLKKEIANTNDLKKNSKTQYRKCKHINSFRDYMLNKPNTYNKMLGKKYTFGMEIETISGYLPTYLDSFIFYDAVHDGSLRDPNGNNYGAEYVTDVLWGDQGLKQLKMLCNELSKRCTINKLCGLHTHLGGINFNKENIVLMYWLYQKLENPIFNMLPPSRRNNEYCRRLPFLHIDLINIQKNYNYFIDNYYNQIINILSQFDCGDNVNKKNDHPKGFKCSYDHSTARYCWVNFIPAVFNTRKNGIYTIEFRNHSATTSYIKSKNWLLICIALVDIIENHKVALYDNPNINLQEIIELVYPKNHLEINNYINKRTMKFSNESIKSGLDQEFIDYTDNEIDDNVLIRNL